MLKNLLRSLILVWLILLAPQISIYAVSAGQQVEFKLDQEPFLTKKLKVLQELWAWFYCAYPAPSKSLAEYLKISLSSATSRESIAKLAQLAKATEKLQLGNKKLTTISKQILSQALKQKSASAGSTCALPSLESFAPEVLDYFADHWLLLGEGLSQPEVQLGIKPEIDRVRLEVMPTALTE